MPAWTAQPYFYGDLDSLSQVFANAATSIQRIGIWGDSRTDPQVNVQDRLLEQRLNYRAFRRFGAASETPIARTAISTRSASLDPQFCVPFAAAYATLVGPFGGAAMGGSVAIGNLPPGFAYRESVDTGAFQCAISLDPGNTSVYNNGTTFDFPWQGVDTFFLNNAVDVAPELFLRKNSGSLATRLQWIDAPTTTPTPSVSATLQASGIEIGIGFDVGTGVIKWRGPTMTYVAGKYENFAWRGLNDSNVVKAGLQTFGARWVNPNRDQGVVFQSFGQGNYDAAEIMDNHPDIGPTIATIGPQAAHVIIIGANDAGSPTYAAPLTNYIVKVRALITALKSAAYGGSATTRIVLANPYVRSDMAFDAYLDQFTQDLIDLCDEFSNVSFVNLARLFQEAGFDSGNTNLSDTVHINNIYTETHYADTLFSSLETLGGLSSISSLSQTSIDALIDAIKADSALGTTGLIADAATAAAQSTSANSKITTGVVLTSSPADVTGQLTDSMVIGDDYLATQDRAYVWTVDAIPGVAFGNASCFFGIKNRTGDGFIVAGTVTEGTGPGTWDLTFDVLKASTDSLVAGAYDWSVEVRDGSGNEITRIRGSRQVRLVAKQT